MDINTLFPKMPSEVFEQFIQPQTIDWPIDSVTGIQGLMTAHNYVKYFRGEGYKFWANVTWTKKTVLYKDVSLKCTSKKIAKDIMSDNELGTDLISTKAGILDSKNRFKCCKSYMEKNRMFPKPVICLDNQTNWDLLDGCHRLAALLCLEENENFPFEVWLGTHVT